MKLSRPIITKEIELIWLKEDIASRLWNSSRKRALKNNIPHTIIHEDIIVVDNCPITGVNLTIGKGQDGPSLDRIIPSLGYVKGNIRVISQRANRIKSDATKNEIELLNKYMEQVSC